MDIESVLHPVTSAQLWTMPGILMVELCNIPQLVEDVQGAVYIARFGYRVFAYINELQKRSLCDFFTRKGLLVLPHRSPHVFYRGSTIVDLHVLARGSEAVGLLYMILLGYGMKTPLSDVGLLSAMTTMVPGLLNRYI